MNHAVPRVVLDTNVCLDLFVFADPRAAALCAALQAGELLAVTDTACRDEWLRVLDYPQLQLDEAARAAAVVAFDARVHCLPDVTPAPTSVDAAMQAATPVPRCKDPDDQKFLQLAQAAGARWLVSRDRHVLALARRTRRDGLFEIVTPDAWVEASGVPQPSR